MARQRARSQNKQPRSTWAYVIIALLVLANLVVAALLVRDFRAEKKAETTTTTAAQVETTASNIGQSYNLTGGTLGAYGLELKLNAGTENESTSYVYILPSGTYKITNNGEYPAQVSLYSATEKATNEETGLEEPIIQPDTTPSTIAPEDFKELVIEAGYGLALNEGDTVTAERVS